MTGRAYYAGFWRRLAALIIDGLVFLPVGILIEVIFFHRLIGLISNYITVAHTQVYLEYILDTFRTQGLLANLFYCIVHWLYSAVMESSSKQATLGKLAVGIKVTDLYGERLSFARATGRYFAEIITSFTFFIGYLMAGFTRNKQALHDFIAGTLVVSNGYSTRYSYSRANTPSDAPVRTYRETPPVSHGDLLSSEELKGEVVCPKCGMINTSSTIFCACCGDELKENTERLKAPRR